MDQVRGQGSRVIIFHRGRPTVAMVPMSDYEKWRPVLESQGVDCERTQVVVTYDGQPSAALISYRTFQALTSQGGGRATST